MLRPEAARSVPPGDPQAVLPLRFTIKTALGPGNRVALTLTSFQARLATLVAARRHAGWRDGTIYHPLNGWRLGMVVLLALAASGLSCRDLLPPMGGRWTFAAAWRARLSFVRHGRSRRSARRFRGTPAQSLSLRAIAPHLLGALAWFGLAVAFFFAFVGLGNTGLILPASISIYIGVPASLVASYMTLRNAYLVYDVEDLTDMSRRFYGMMNGLYVFLVASLIYYMGALYQPSSESAEVAFSVLALLAVWLAAVMEGIWAAKLFRGAGSSTNRVPGLVLLKVLAFLVATVLSVPVIVGATLYLSEFFGGVAGNLGVLTYSGVLAIALLLVVRIRVAEAGVIFFKLVFNVLLLGFALSLSLVVLTAASTIDIGNSSIALALGSIATALVPLVAIRLLRPWTARHFFRNVAQALRQPRWT